MVMGLSSKNFQSLIGNTQIAARFQLGGGSAVVSRLSLMYFGDGCQTHLVALASLLQLVRQGFFFSDTGFESIYGAQHIEVSLGHTHDRALLICAKLSHRQVGLFAALLVVVPGRHIKQWLL